jgi:sulfofructose kinase
MAANAAAAIGRLGGAVELWSRTGADEAGRKIRAYLEADGVDIRYVRAFEGRRSSTSAILVDGKGERLIAGERDHAMSLDASWLPLERIGRAGAVMSDFRWIEATRASFEAARAAGVPTIIDVDLGAGELLFEVLRLADYAIFSRPALEEQVAGGSDRERLAEVLELGAKHAGVTRGSAGYTWVSRDGRSGFQPAFEVEVVDTTGAGDAFHGAFAWALVQGYGDEGCARIASAVAAMKCRRLGARAGLPTKSELEAFLAAAGAGDLARASK